LCRQALHEVTDANPGMASLTDDANHPNRARGAGDLCRESQGLRFAEANGAFDAAFQALSQMSL
jgi:hypothetical protein